MAKQVIKLTEQDLHRIIKESVSKVLNEIGDTFEKPKEEGGLGLPKGGGKYYLAKKAAQEADKQGRKRQKDNFEDYATTDFNDKFMVNNPDVEFYMDGNTRNPNFNSTMYRGEHDLGPSGTEREAKRKTNRNLVRASVPNLKAAQRNKVNNGLNTFDMTHNLLNKDEKA